MPAHEALERSQKKLFRTLAHELEILDRSKSPEIRAYERSFHTSLPKAARASTKDALVSAARAAQVILVGDFHPFRQSQKGFLRLLREAQKPGKTVVGLECVPISRQYLLNAYCASHLTAEELREELDFEKEWPFSWPSYKEILEYARQQHLPLLALNLEHNRDPKLLPARDEAAAHAILAALAKRPKGQVFVLFGELHLGRKHLPKHLRSVNTLLVHQNETSLYWKAPLKNGHRAEVLRLKKDEYCVLNSVPWVKLRSYLDWLEGNEEDAEWEDGMDATESIQQFAALLGQALHLIPGPANVEVFSGNQVSPRALSAEEKSLRKHSATFHRTGFLPVKGYLLLPSLSTNALGEGASLALWHSGGAGHPKKAAVSGSRLVAQFLVAYLGSKILNPKRKCNEVADIVALLKGSLPPAKRKVLTRTLTLLAPYLKIGKPKMVGLLSGSLEIEACRLAGYILANRLFYAWLRDDSLVAFIRTIYGTSNASTTWADRLLKDVAKKIQKKKISPPSKKSEF